MERNLNVAYLSDLWRLNIAYLNGSKKMHKKIVFHGDTEGDETTDQDKPNWTGHADVEGLKAIGWTDEDIAYYQENGVNWNAEDDQYHKVPEDNIALYGVLTTDNISTYKDRIVYLPKIDTSNVTDMSYMFNSCSSLVSIPLLDTSNVTDMRYMFHQCTNLVSIPQLNTSNVTDMSYMFSYCKNLVYIPQLDTSNVKKFSYMFHICEALVTVKQIDFYNVGNDDEMFNSCYTLQDCFIKNIRGGVNLLHSYQLTKESILYMINNSTKADSILIVLHRTIYKKYSTDADVTAALANHPNVSLST